MSKQQKTTAQPIHLIVEPGTPLYNALLECVAPLLRGGRDVLEPHSVDSASVSIQDLGLSARVINLLFGAGVRTLADLAATRSDDLLAIDGFGKKTLDEIRHAWLQFSGLTAPSPETVSALESVSIEAFEFSVVAYNALKRADIKTVGDLCRMSEPELIQVLPSHRRGMPQSLVQEITEKLRDRGLCLRW